jgi:hypothetical protein
VTKGVDVLTLTLKQVCRCKPFMRNSFFISVRELSVC